jgi:hypothetical protein
MDNVAVREISREEYIRFLEKTPHSAFHGIAWLDAVAAVFTLRVRLLGYFNDGALVAVTPLTGRHIGPVKIWGAPLRKCATPAATPYCSPQALSSDLLPFLHQWIAEQRLWFVQVTVPGVQVPRASMAGLIEPLDNLELDLQPTLDQIWKSISDLPRRCIRKAVRNGVRIHWHNMPEMLAIQRTLVAATYLRQGIHPNIPERMYEKLLAHRANVGLRVLCATHAGRAIATVWILNDEQKCYYWDAAALNEARILDANHLLVWCLIRWAHRKGFTALDFVGTSIGGRGGSRPGIGRFKQSMGGRPVEYRLVYWYSPLMRAALAGYRLVSRLRARIRAIRRKNHANRT